MKQLKQLLLFFSLFILTQNVFSMTEPKEAHAPSHFIAPSYKKVEIFYKSQEIRLRYLDTISDLLHSEKLDLETKFQLVVSLSFSDNIKRNSSQKEDATLKFTIDLDRYRLMRHYLQNFVSFIIKTSLSKDEFFLLYNLFVGEFASAQKEIAGDYIRNDEELYSLSHRTSGAIPPSLPPSSLLYEECSFMESHAAGLVYSGEEKKEIMALPSLPENPRNEHLKKLFLVDETLAAGTIEKHQQAQSKARDLDLSSYKDTRYDQGLPPTFVTEIISDCYNSTSALKRHSHLKNQLVFKEYLARLSSLIISKKTPIIGEDINKFKDKIEGLVMSSFNEVKRSVKEKGPSSSVTDKSDFMPKTPTGKVKVKGKGKGKGKSKRKGKKTVSSLSPATMIVPVVEEKTAKKSPSAHTPTPISPVSVLAIAAPTPVAGEVLTEVAPISEDFSLTISPVYQPTPYEEYARSGGCNREWMAKLKLEHDEFYKGRVEPVKMTIATSPFNDLEKQFLKDIIFGPMSAWKRYSWNDIEKLLKDAGWGIDDGTGSSSVHFTPRAELHGILGSHAVSIHRDHTPHKRPVAAYCVEFLKMAFKNSYGIEETDIKKP